MNIKKTIFIPLLFATICFFGIFLCNSPISNSQAKNKTTNSKIELSNKIIAQNKISYKFKYTLTPNDPLITIFSRDVKRVDLNSLKKELGEKNIGLDLDNNSIHVNLKDNINQNGQGKFQITAIGKDDLDIEIADLNENLLYSKKTIPETALESADDTVTGTENANNNAPENTNIDELHDVESEETSREDNSANKTTQITDSNLDYKQPPLVPGGEDWNQDWLKQDNLLISMGIPKKLDDGRTSYPVLYFGALNYALNHTKVYDSVGGRPGAVGLGSGRKNNITAANSGIINVPKNGNVDAEQQKKNDPNKFLNFTFGDGLLFGDGTAFRPDAVYRGSQRNWTTTNIFDFYKPTGNIMKPAIYGPDFEKLSGDWGLDEKSARFYVKQYSVGSGKNQHHFVAQRIVYRQVLKKGYAIQVTTTQQFDENNSVIITTEFKNVGNKYIDNFQGYTFRDITFLRDHRRKGSKQDNVIRSLGKNRGVYASRNGEFGSRIEFKLSGYPDSPYAWSGRGTRSSFYQSSRKDHFPWNSKGLFNTYNDAFEDIDDVGDKGSEPGFGNSWMDSKHTTDSGIAMHTKNQPLHLQDQVSMTYAVNMIEKDEAPILNLENEGTKGRPYVLKPEENEIKLLGDWRYDRNQDVNIKYHTEDAIDEDDGLTPEKIIKNGKFVQENPYHQSKDDMHNGVPQNWDKTIPLNELGSGLQKISVVAYDAVENVEELDPNNADDEPVSSRKLDENKSKRVSKIESFYVMIPEREEIIPELELKIFRPISGHSESDPYEPRKDLDFVDSIDVSGIVQNKDSSAEQTNNFWLTYQVNGGDEKPLEIPDDVKGNNKPVPWHLKDLDLSEFMTYQGIIPIKFTVRNDFGMVVSETLYIQMKNNDEHNLPDGTISIYAPGDINFGVKHMAPNSETDAKPSFTENLIVDDHRRMEKRDTPVNISFKTEEFKLKNDSDNILDTQLYWKNRELREQEEYTFENFEKKNRVILNDLFKKNIHLKIKSDKPVKQGHFISEWTWSLTESL